MSSFQFVFIPVDTNRPLEEWSQEIEKDHEVECLLDRLKAHFSEAHPATTKKQRQRHKEELLRHKRLQNAPGGISEKLLEAATSMQLVESIALLPCMPRFGCVGVTLYVDDSGSFKQLPVNTRATDIALSCGVASSQVLGDAFIGRVRESEEEFERMDFLVKDLRSDALWMRDARTHYQQKMTQPTAEEILKQMKPQEPPQITEITPAEEARQKGNEAYRRGSYAEAIAAYTECLEHDPDSALAYSNRSMAQLQLKDFTAALADAEAALKLDQSSIKACFRRGVALEGLERREEALEAFSKILAQQPNHKAATEKLQALQS